MGTLGQTYCKRVSNQDDKVFIYREGRRMG